ncbi:MAG TPA: hypothetical protein VK570_05100, partial [Rubrivivax sp.]|nr:hypothetical protein [Rubrivivax sp.]
MANKAAASVNNQALQLRKNYLEATALSTRVMEQGDRCAYARSEVAREEALHARTWLPAVVPPPWKEGL